MSTGVKHEQMPWFARGGMQHVTLVIAEIGNVHEGSLGNIINYINACADVGVDGIKLQAHSPNESTNDEKFPSRFSYHPQDLNRKEYWCRLAIRNYCWDHILNVCLRRGIKLIVSPFSVDRVNIIEMYIGDCLFAYKIASGEVNNKPLLKEIAKTKRSVVISTGMSDTLEVNNCLSYFPCQSKYVLQCTTEYPCEANKIGMNVCDCFCRNITFKGGLSDHSGTIYPSIVASYLGAWMVEVHICWDKRQFGADVSSSLTIDELAQLVKGVKFATEMRKYPINKDTFITTEEMNVYRQGKNR